MSVGFLGLDPYVVRCSDCGVSATVQGSVLVRNFVFFLLFTLLFVAVLLVGYLWHKNLFKMGPFTQMSEVKKRVP